MNTEKHLPPIKEWPNKPLLIRRSPLVPTNGSLQGNTLTLHIHNPAGPTLSEISISSPNFIGKAYIIIRHLPGAPEEYFAAKNRQFQVVIQGRFTRPVSYASVYTGQVFNRSLDKLIPRWVLRMALPLLRSLQPAMELQLEGDTSYVLTPLASTAKNIVVSRPGAEPSISQLDTLQEDMSLILDDTIRDAAARRKYFSNKDNLELFSFDPSLVYTFDFYQHVINLPENKLQMGFAELSLKNILVSSPLQIMSMLWTPSFDVSSAEYLYNIEIWHCDNVDEHTAIS